MLNRFLLAAVLVAAAAGLQAKASSTSQQLLDALLTQHNFFQAAPAPFLLEADFTAQANVPTQGHLRIRWQSKDHWWSRVDFGPFQQIRIRNGEMEYTLRNFEFTPLQIVDLLNLFNIGEDLVPVTAKKVTTRTEADAQLVCVQGRVEGPSKDAHEFCADRATHDLLSNSWNEAPDQSRRQRFTDYVEANGLRYPRQLDMYMNSSKLVSARITLFQSSPFDSTLLEPPNGAIERRKCADLKRPVPRKKVNIDFGRRPGLTSQDMLVLTILTDGSVGDIHVVQSGGSSLDKPAVEAFRNWKFKPAMCGSEPVIDEITVVVSYRRVSRSRFRTPAGNTGVVTVKIR